MLIIFILTLMNDKKRVLKQFEWFEVQTKVRQIISQIMQPLEKKVISNSISIGKLQQANRDEQSKLNTIIMMVNNDPQIFQHGIFTSIEAKFHDQGMLIHGLSNRVQHFQQFIAEKTAIMDRRMAESNEVLQNINQYKLFVNHQVQNLNCKLIESQQSLFNSLQQINGDISKAMINIDVLKGEHELQKKRIDMYDKLIGQTTHEVDAKLDTYSKWLKQMKFQVDQNHSHIHNLLEQLKRVDSFQKHNRKLQGMIHQFQITISNLEYKIQVIQPMISLTQTNEYLHHALPPKYHNNLSIYFYNRYDELVKEVLGNQFKPGKVKQSIKDHLNLIKQVHKRATKLVYKLKKEELLSRNINIDLLSHEKMEEHLAEIKLVESFKQIQIDSEQNKTKVEVKQTTEIKLSDDVDKLLKQIKQKMNIQMKDSKQYILQMEFIIKKEQQQIQQIVNSVVSKCNQLGLNQQLQSKANLNIVAKVDRKLNDFYNEQSRVALCLIEVYNIMLAFNQIQKQDQKDRQSIRLLGVRQQHRDDFKNSKSTPSPRRTSDILQISKDCLSCSGNPNYYNQFFKMACLTYNSTPIHFNGQVYQRIDLLDKAQQQLQLLHGQIHTKQTRSQAQSNKKDISSVDEQHILTQRYESHQMFCPTSKDFRSASDANFIVRNISTSQQIRTNQKKEFKEDEPRIINANELTYELMNRTRNRLFQRRKDTPHKDSKSKRQENSRQRSDYMIHVSRHFTDLKKQNEEFIK